MIPIINNITLFRAKIEDLAVKYGHNSSPIGLVVVTKGRDISKLRGALGADCKDFGESYIQESLPKIQALSGQGICWHFIGQIQANKTADIAQNFDWAHSIDRIKIAERLSSQRPESLAPLNVCLQVDIDGESQKGGVRVDALLGLARAVNDLQGLCLRGVMMIGKKGASSQEQSISFARARQAYEMLQSNGLNVDTLSMGMSGDFEVAIKHGATMLRLGSDIFDSA